jgi:hypothetical protein
MVVGVASSDWGLESGLLTGENSISGRGLEGRLIAPGIEDDKLPEVVV